MRIGKCNRGLFQLVSFISTSSESVQTNRIALLMSVLWESSSIVHSYIDIHTKLIPREPKQQIISVFYWSNPVKVIQTLER